LSHPLQDVEDVRVLGQQRWSLSWIVMRSLRTEKDQRFLRKRVVHLLVVVQGADVRQLLVKKSRC
jgi:hypothetical protein